MLLSSCLWIMHAVVSLEVATQERASHGRSSHKKDGEGGYASALQEDGNGASTPAIGMREDGDHTPVVPERHSAGGDHPPVVPEAHSEGPASGSVVALQEVSAVAQTPKTNSTRPPQVNSTSTPTMLVAWVDDVHANFAKFEAMAAAQVVAWTIVAIVLGVLFSSFMYLCYMAYYGTYPSKFGNGDAAPDTSRTATTALLEEDSLPRPRDGRTRRSQLPDGQRRSQLPEGQTTPGKGGEEKRGSKK